MLPVDKFTAWCLQDMTSTVLYCTVLYCTVLILDILSLTEKVMRSESLSQTSAVET